MNHDAFTYCFFRTDRVQVIHVDFESSSQFLYLAPIHSYTEDWDNREEKINGARSTTDRIKVYFILTIFYVKFELVQFEEGKYIEENYKAAKIFSKEFLFLFALLVGILFAQCHLNPKPKSKGILVNFLLYTYHKFMSKRLQNCRRVQSTNQVHLLLDINTLFACFLCMFFSSSRPKAVPMKRVLIIAINYIPGSDLI